jgi:hypothetical protein
MSRPAPLTAHTAPCDIEDAHTLVGEHARLMRDVHRRAAPVQALLTARVWPHAELGALTSLLRSAVLRQVADEEVHLFPNDASGPPFAELTTAHLRLRSLTAQLENAHAKPCSQAELRGLVNELLHTLRRHLEDEQRILAALPVVNGEIPSVAGLAATGQSWFGNDHSPVCIELEKLPSQHATGLCVERLLRLTPGETAEVHADDRLMLRTVRRWLHDFDPSSFGLEQMTAGQDNLLRVTRRRADASAGIGYPG